MEVRVTFMGPGLACPYCHSGLNGIHPVGCPGEKLTPGDTADAIVERNRVAAWLRHYVQAEDMGLSLGEANHLRLIADRIQENDLYRLSPDGKTARP